MITCFGQVLDHSKPKYIFWTAINFKTDLSECTKYMAYKKPVENILKDLSFISYDTLPNLEFKLQRNKLRHFNDNAH